jgi:hypothetical protein
MPVILDAFAFEGWLDRGHVELPSDLDEKVRLTAVSQKQRCANSGASMPHSRIRWSSISMVSPSITRAAPSTVSAQARRGTITASKNRIAVHFKGKA